MVRRVCFVLVLFAAGLVSVQGKEAEARNEDVPKGPAIAAPSQNSSKPSQFPTGSVNGRDKGNSPSGIAKPAGNSGKGAAPSK
jgi:hypothetical protein